MKIKKVFGEVSLSCGLLREYGDDTIPREVAIGPLHSSNDPSLLDRVTYAAIRFIYETPIGNGPACYFVGFVRISTGSLEQNRFARLRKPHFECYFTTYFLKSNNTCNG